MKFYFIGIKGAGMCSLSNILYDLSYEIRGSDYCKDYFTSFKLKSDIIIDNIDESLISSDFIYIIGNAFKNHTIVDQIKLKGCTYYNYPSFIQEFFNIPKISISGTHGKTTTTSFISQLVNCDINVLCGDGYGRGSVDAKYLLLEACEYKDHFLNYTNKILLINNIEYDHPDYFINLNHVIDSFQKAANNSQILIINGDCSNCNKIKHSNILRFGIKDNNDITFKYSIKRNNTLVTINFYQNIIDIELPLLTKHNVYNYVAAYIISKLIDIKDDVLINKSKLLKLPSRRMNIYNYKNSILVDDYAHHPTEIKSTILSLKQLYSNYKIIVFFQPHTYSRTNSLLNNFIESLSLADDVYILDVFSSVREYGNENLLLLNSTFNKFNNEILNDIGFNKEIYIFMGAGDVNNLMKIFIN